MSKKIDLIGQVYGRLTVLEDVGRRGSFVLWRCQCSCGNLVDVVSVQLRSGKTKSCGCYKREQTSKRSRMDLTGQKFGRLVVLEDVGRTKRQQVIWRCQCVCGNTVEVSSNSLRQGNTQSCGCYAKEQTSEAHKKDLTGQRFGRWLVLEERGISKQGNVQWLCRCDCGTERIVVSGSLMAGVSLSCGCYNKERITATHFKDLTGKVFGRLTALKYVGQNKKKQSLWQCQCECGNIKDVVGVNLCCGNTQSCGCFQKDQLIAACFKDLTNQKFGRWTVLKRDGYAPDNRTILWLCQCDCGNQSHVAGSSLTSGNSKSCGCYARERTSQANLGANNGNWKGGTTPLHVGIRMLTEYDSWRTTVFSRDKYLCQRCNKSHTEINAHHINTVANLIKEYHITTLDEVRQCDAFWDIDNGITLCKKCHKQTHREMRDAKKTRRT